MGLSRPKGPVYGAKSLLWSVGPALASTGASTHAPFPTISNLVLPAYEDWYITEFRGGFSTGSSAGNSIILKSKGGSTSIIPNPDAPGAGSTITQTLANLNGSTSTTFIGVATVTATAGEYEGAWVPAGSTLYVVSTSVNALSNFWWAAYGFIRFRASTRSEG